jgi:hypothetical protein
MWSVRRLHAVDDAQIDQLARVLIDCVDGGASVSFMHPLTRDRAEAFWRRVAQGVAAAERALLVAEDAHGFCGTVQLVLDQPENQRTTPIWRRCWCIAACGGRAWGSADGPPKRPRVNAENAAGARRRHPWRRHARLSAW